MTFILIAGATALYAIKSTNNINDIYDNIVSSSDSSSVGGLNKKIVEKIKNYNALPAASRSAIVGTLQNMCKNSQDLSAEATNVTASLITINADCKDAKTTVLTFELKDGKWQKVIPPANTE